MLKQILGAVARREVEVIKRRVTGLGFALAATLVVLLALVFAFFALFLWLSTRYEPWQAALVVVGVLLLLALLVWLAGRMVVRRATRPDSRVDEHVDAILNDLGLGGKRDEAPFSTVGSALAVGFAIGRKLPK